LCIAAGHFLHRERAPARALGAPVISNHTRRKNAKQRAGKITDLLLDAEKRPAGKENSNICTNSLKFVSFSEHIVTGNGRKIRNAQ
jgi:hypothetical protein